MENSKYVCIFENKPCPAKNAYKLSPESLAQFCKVCVEKIKWDSLMKAIEAVSTMMNKQTKLEKEVETVQTIMAPSNTESFFKLCEIIAAQKPS
jgi:hypothetical protein